MRREARKTACTAGLDVRGGVTGDRRRDTVSSAAQARAARGDQRELRAASLMNNGQATSMLPVDINEMRAASVLVV